jgi:hypothetical protein
VRPIVALKLLPLPEQTALLDEELGHANAAVTACSASPASVRRTSEGAVKRSIGTQWEREES